MRTSKSLPLAVAALVALSGCTADPIETERHEDSGAAPEPFEREVTPTETSDEDENVADPERQTTDFEGSVVATDHQTDGTFVMVDRAEIDGRIEGWVVIHESTDGAPGSVIGKRSINSALETNEVTDFRVELDEPLPEGEHRVWVMLHIDASEIGTYEFPGPDEPLVVDGDVVQVPVTVLVDPDAS